MTEPSYYENYFDARGVAASFYDDYHLPAYLVAVLGNNKNISILDFGCGYGQNLQAMKKLGFENIAGYDIEPTALEYCKKNDLKTVDGRITSLEELGNFYDLIVMTHVLEHLPKHQIIDNLRSLRMALKEEGRLFVAVPNAQSNTGCYWRYEDFTHHTLFTAGSLLFVLRQAGYSKMQIHDKDCLSGVYGWKKIIRKIFLSIYRRNNEFWNKITASSYHSPSPIVNSYEVKVVAEK